MDRRIFRRVLRALAALALAGSAAAQLPAFRHFDVASGLAHGRVTCFLSDSRGYEWIGTWEGLARFDGAEFRTFDARDGLPRAFVNTVEEDAHGSVWAGTHGGGLWKLADEPARAGAAFTRVAAGEADLETVYQLAFDAHGALWCGTLAGLLRCDDPRASSPVFTRVADGLIDWIALDPVGDGAWAGCSDDVFHASARGVEHLPLPGVQGPQSDGLVDARGVLVATRDHVLALEHGTWRDTHAPCASGATFRALLRDPDGTTWIGTSGGLVRRGADGDHTWTERDGLPQDVVETLARDREGNLWAGGTSAGAVVFLASGIESWTHVAGETLHDVMALARTPRGVVAGTSSSGLFAIEDGAARWIAGSREGEFRSVHMRLLLDRAQRWWLGTNDALWLAPGPELDLARAVHIGPERGGPASGVFGAFHEDPTGRVLFASFDGELFTCEPGTSLDVRLTKRALAPVLGAARVAWTDARARLWLASYDGLARFDGGEPRALDAAAGFALRGPRCLVPDERGRLWIGTRLEGVWCLDDPLADPPHLRQLTTRDGLPSDSVWWAASGADGATWLATSRGLCQLDADGAPLRVLGRAEGLAGDHVPYVLATPDGSVWAATSAGVSRFDPRALRDAERVPDARLVHVEFAGAALPLPEIGATHVDAGALVQTSGPLHIEWSAPCVRAARELRFECRLAGADESWNAPIAARSLSYAALAPGDYLFQVHAVGARARTHGEAAELAFTILPPVWRRPWFVALTVLALAGLAYAVHRARVERALALERIRRQIATDIHDDLGSGLSQVAVLSEVARRAETAPQRELAEIARLARGMRESMAEIVWSVDPARDTLAELVTRVRQVAENLLEAEGVEVALVAPMDAASHVLRPDLRRHVFLFAKEALTNVARHARAKHVAVSFAVRGGALVFAVRDDGGGFDSTASHAGQGLASFRQRAEKLGARLTIESEPGRGTHVELAAPLET